MHKDLKQRILREILLEDEDYKKTLSAIKKYQVGPTIEKKSQLVEQLREKITSRAKELLAPEQITQFIDDMGEIGDIEE